MPRGDASEMSLVLRLRLLQYRRLIRRWLHRLIEDRWLALLYSIAFVGGAAWAYSNLPSALSQAIRISKFPIALAATRVGLSLLVVLIWRQLTRGIRYPPVYLARGDISILLAGPVDRRVVIALRLVRAYVSAALALAVPMILLGPFLVRIWDGMSPARLALVWLHLSIGWICLIHWRWRAFHTVHLKRVAYVVRWTGYVLAGVALLALFIAWGIGPRISLVSASEVALTVFPWWTLPRPGVWSLGILSTLAVLSWFAVWRSLPRVSLEGLVRFSLFVGESLDLFWENRMDEMQRLVARMRRVKGRGRKHVAIGYRIGARAIAGKAVTMILRQSPLAFAFVVPVYVGALIAFVYFPLLWGRALILAVIATSLANFPLVSLQKDLRNWAFARQLPFSATQWVDGNAVVLWGWQTALGWIFLVVLFGRGMIAGAEFLPLLIFVVITGYLIAHQGVSILIAEVRSHRFLQFAVRAGCLAAFALLAGAVVLLRATGLPSWTAWIAASSMGIPLSRAWRLITVRQVQTLISRPWENEQSL